jgi:hypothetical protein
MRFAKPLHLASVLPLLLLVCAPRVSRAQTGGGYDLTWNTIDGGGATFSIGAGYVLGGTIGQPDAGTLAGAAFTLAGGFWQGGALVSTGVDPDGPPIASLPAAFQLHPSAPNPFNPQTTVAFDLPSASSVHLAVYSLRGALVRTLANEAMPAGRYQRRWDGKDNAGAPVASGTYLVRLQAGAFRDQHKVSLIK